MVREDPAKKGFLSLGTERGVMLSPDAGKTWQSLQLNLPTVPVHDLVVKDNDLVVATHGRAIWILDDLTPIRDTTAAVKKKAIHLFPVQAATKWYTSWGGSSREFLPTVSGENPDAGAVVWFHLGSDFKGEVKLEILDAKGRVIASAMGKANREGEAPAEPASPNREGEAPAEPADSPNREGEAPAEPADSPNREGEAPAEPADSPKRKLEPKPGLNRFVWDLTHDGATTILGAPVDSGGAGARVPVAPGAYTVRLTLANQKFTQRVRVTADPRWLATAARPPIPAAAFEWNPLQTGISGPDYAELHRLLAQAASLKFETGPDELSAQEALTLRVRDDITKLSGAVARIRAIKKQTDLRKDLLKDRDDAKALLKQTDALAKKLDDLEGKLHNSKAKISYDIFAAKGGAMLYSQLAWLLANLTDGDGAPTKAQQELADDLQKELTALLGQFDGIAKTDLAKLNDAAKKLGVPELYVPPAKTADAKPPAKK